MSYLLDTNVISELVAAKPNRAVLEWVSSIPVSSTYLSVLTLGEIRKGIEKVSDAKRKNKLILWLEVDLAMQFEERILEIDIKVADRWGRLQADAKRSLPAIDSLIAATALHHDLTLVTRNVNDFHGIDLPMINPWE